MANPQGNHHPPPFTKHSYPKFKGRGDDDDADSYIKLFESVFITNKEDNDADRMRIFPGLLRKKAQSWYNHESTVPTGIDTWIKLRCETIDNVIVSAEAYETFTLNRRPKDRPHKEQKSKSSRRKQRPTTPSSSKSSLSSESSESEDLSSSEEEKTRKKANKKKNRRMSMPKKGSTSIVSKVDALAKDFANLKSGCQHGKRVGITRKTQKETAYAVQEETPVTPIQQAHIPRYAPKDMATTVPQPRAQVRFITPPPKEDAQVNQVELSPEDKEEESEWPDEETMMGRVESRSSSCRKEAISEKVKRDKTKAKKKDPKVKEVRELKKIIPPKISESSAKKGKTLAEDLWTSLQEV
ncbi:hypothetical protein AXG93_4649s1030 [Marchantia polymorpha subsp. ruderalis]|uniref:Retrotransposon gag domain-containing protein n=1 Tax=Marchantia polymorpha subsp. ruderalis TaxID=1480154 RepID=A0A176VG21_MARPO|nr:hypothetical protein AXG93_4649s1030 [Marchantia polymorpha subsp. ruderalis]